MFSVANDAALYSLQFQDVGRFILLYIYIFTRYTHRSPYGVVVLREKCSSLLQKPLLRYIVDYLTKQVYWLGVEVA